MNEMFNEYKALFIEEAEEYIAALNDNLIALEKDNTDRKLIDNIFRIAHTLKSSAAAVGLTDMSELAHKAEDVMQKIRSAEIEITTDVVDAFFEVFDVIHGYVESIKRGEEPVVNLKKILKRLEDAGTQMKKTGKVPAEEKHCPLVIELTDEEKKQLDLAAKNGMTIYKAEVAIDPREPLKWLRGELVLNKITKLGRILKVFPEKSRFIQYDFNGIFAVFIGSNEPADRLKEEMTVDLIKSISIDIFAKAEGEPATGKEAEKNSSVVPVSPLPSRNGIKEAGTSSISAGDPRLRGDDKLLKVPSSQQSALDPQKSETVVADERIEKARQAEAAISRAVEESSRKDQQKARTADTIKVGIEKLDSMMNLIGELATIISGFHQVEKKALAGKNELAADIAIFIDRLSNISSDLQFSIMNTRMLPVSSVFNQFNRIVRDLSREENKEINLLVKGEETELDKKIIDTLGEPLRHLVRNAVDHGIESAEERRSAGKPEGATVTLSAERSGNRIVITVSDDGKGIDLRRVKEKAVEKGLATQEQTDNQSDDQNLQYIFKPGFSTAEKVSNVSGRGVGLDVVKNVVTELNGSIDIVTETGIGTEFIIYLPLTLTTTSVILVKAGTGMFAIPINDILESLVLPRDEIRQIDGTLAFNLRGEVLPLISLSNVFEGAAVDEASPKVSIMVVFYKDRKVGLLIDRIEGTEEIVLKNLEKNYRNLKGLSGAAILGDGRITLVIDVLGIMQIIRDRHSKSERKRQRKPGSSTTGQLSAKKSSTAGAVVGARKNESKSRERDGAVAVLSPGAEKNRVKNAAIPPIFEKAFSQAAASLSQLTGRDMKIHFRRVDEIPGSEILVNQLDDRPEEIYIGSLIKTKEGLKSNIVFLISDAEGRDLYDILYGNPSGTTRTSSDDVMMAMGEINNILSSSFINNLANRLEREVHPSTPRNTRDMLAALMEAVATQEDLIGRKVLCAETVISESGSKEFHPRMLIITDQEGLRNFEAGSPA